MNRTRSPFTRRAVLSVALAATGTLALTGCLAGENAASTEEAPTASELNIDFATYNPLSLVIKDQGWLEAELEDEGVTVNWIQSAGSNKANELLRSGEADVASTAGSAALMARANGSPIKTVEIYSQPEWSALVTTGDTGIESAEDLRGKSIAATKGTDPYFFLLQSLAEHNVDPSEVTIQNIQHADGWAALNTGSVDAWSGLDPIMAAAEEDGAELFYRNVDFNTYGFLNATESFLEESPELAQTVVNAYEKARQWAQENPEETAAILAEVAGIEESVANKVIVERSNLDVDGTPGQAQLDVLEVVGPMFVESGDVASQESIDEALATLLDDTYATNADPSAIGE